VTTNVPAGGTIVGGTATCPAGKIVTGGGASVSGLINNAATADGTGPHPFQSSPSGTTGWSASYISSQAYAGQFAVSVYAICVNQP
jgi:hypothetical protein